MSARRQEPERGSQPRHTRYSPQMRRVNKTHHIQVRTSTRSRTSNGRNRRSLLILALAMSMALTAAGLTSTAQGVGAQTTPTASPTTDLIDGQEVVITSTVTDGYISTAICTQAGNCAYLETSGYSPASLYIPAAFQGASADGSDLPQIFDCRVTTCTLQVTEYSDALPQPVETSIPITFNPSAPMLPDPVPTISPQNNLIDGQNVDLSIANLWPTSGEWSSPVYVEQCTPDGLCSNFQSTDEPIVIAATLHGSDCRVVACYLRINPGHPRFSELIVPLDFDAAAPLRPPIILTATEGVTSPGASITITGTGLVPFSQAELQRCEGNVCTWVESAKADANGNVTIDAVLCEGANVECTFNLTNLVWTATVTVTTAVPADAKPFCDPIYQSNATLDVPYRTAVDHEGNTIELALDIYEPVGDPEDGLRPVLLWMHGGYFQFGSKAEIFGMNSFARRGYVVISIDYRKRTIDGTAGQPSDAAVRDTYEDESGVLGRARR